MDKQGDIHFEMPKDFAIEEVEGHLEGSNKYVIDAGSIWDCGVEEIDANSEAIDVADDRETKTGDIEEAETVLQEGSSVIDGGDISWKSVKTDHKIGMRIFITSVTLSLWIFWTIIGLMTFTHTGNPILLISSPSTVMGIALYRILFTIVKYYF